jgi:endoglycosylceramidase
VIAGIRETSPAVRTAFQSFWNDTPAALGVGVRTLYARMLGHLAGRFAGEPAVAGFDVMNEPNAFPPEEQQSLSDLYADALREIRAAEAAAGDRPHLLFFEPSALWSAFGSGAPPDFERDRDVVYSPHIYTGGLDSRPLTAEAFRIAVDEARIFGGAPVFCGEWGSDPRRASDPEDEYFATHQRLQDDFRISATLWTWRESCGDPHKAADYRAGRVPYVWGEFEVDCATNAVTGVRQDLVDQLTRGWVRAAPGKLVELRYDPDTGLLTARGTDAPVDARLVAFYPASRHGSPTIHGEGLLQAETLPAGGGNAYITARAIGGEWRLEVGG